jgi:hypothetical protein
MVLGLVDGVLNGMKVQFLLPALTFSALVALARILRDFGGGKASVIIIVTWVWVFKWNDGVSSSNGLVRVTFLSGAEFRLLSGLFSHT